MKVAEIQWPTRSNQLIAGLALAVFLAASVFYFWQRSITNNGLIDFEDIPSRSVSFEVDINSAAWPEFANLPGIGEKLAKQIINHRQQHGPFESVTQLTNVSGIGPAKLNGMLPFIVVDISIEHDGG